MFDGITDSISQGIARTTNFIGNSAEKIKKMIRECIAESIPEEVKDVAVRPIQTTQVESEDLHALTQDPSLENFQELTDKLGSMFTRRRDHESYSLIIKHLRGDTAEEKAANFRKLFKPKEREDGSIGFIFEPTHREISECLTENNQQIRSACRDLQTATQYSFFASDDTTVIKTLVAIGYGTAELGAQLSAKLHQLGTVVSNLLPEQENQQAQSGRGNNNAR